MFRENPRLVQHLIVAPVPPASLLLPTVHHHVTLQHRSSEGRPHWTKSVSNLPERVKWGRTSLIGWKTANTSKRFTFKKGLSMIKAAATCEAKSWFDLRRLDEPFRHRASVSSCEDLVLFDGPLGKEAPLTPPSLSILSLTHARTHAQEVLYPPHSSHAHTLRQWVARRELTGTHRGVRESRIGW